MFITDVNLGTRENRRKCKALYQWTMRL